MHRNIEENRKIAAAVKNQTYHHFSLWRGINELLKVSEAYFSYYGRFLEIFENIDYRKYPLKRVCMLKKQRFLKNME